MIILKHKFFFLDFCFCEDQNKGFFFFTMLKYATTIFRKDLAMQNLVINLSILVEMEHMVQTFKH